MWWEKSLNSNQQFRESIARANKHIAKLSLLPEFDQIDKLFFSYSSKLNERQAQSGAFPGVAEEDIEKTITSKLGLDNKQLAIKMFRASRLIFNYLVNFFNIIGELSKNLSYLSDQDALTLVLDQANMKPLDEQLTFLMTKSSELAAKLKNGTRKVPVDGGDTGAPVEFNDHKLYSSLPLNNDELKDVLAVVDLRELEINKLDASTHLKKDLIKRYLKSPTNREQAGVITHASTKLRARLLYQAAHEELNYQTDLRDDFETMVRIRLDRIFSKRKDSNKYIELVQKWSAVLFVLHKRLVDFELNLLKFIESLNEAQGTVYQKFIRFYKNIAISFGQPVVFINKLKLGMELIRKEYASDLVPAIEVVNKKYNLFALS